MAAFLGLLILWACHLAAITQAHPTTGQSPIASSSTSSTFSSQFDDLAEVISRPETVGSMSRVLPLFWTYTDEGHADGGHNGLKDQWPHCGDSNYCRIAYAALLCGITFCTIFGLLWCLTKLLSHTLRLFRQRQTRRQIEVEPIDFKAH